MNIKTIVKPKHMKKILMVFALLTGMLAAMAQQSNGDLYEGLTRKIGFSRMIPPHGLEIDVRQDRPRHFPRTGEIRGPGVTQPDCRQG